MADTNPTQSEQTPATEQSLADKVKGVYNSAVQFVSTVRAKIRSAIAKVTEQEKPLDAAKKAVASAEAMYKQVVATTEPMLSNPAQKTLVENMRANAQAFVTAAKAELTAAEGKLGDEYKAAVAEKTAAEAELAPAEAKLAEAKGPVIEYLKTLTVDELAELAFPSFVGAAPKARAEGTGTGTSKAKTSDGKAWPDNPSPGDVVIVSGTPFKAVIQTTSTGKERIKFPGLKEALIQAGATEDDWNGKTSTGQQVKTTSFRVARDLKLGELVRG